MTVVVSALVALLTAAAGAVGAYAVARRQHSGTVATADAETIFQASEQIRQELRATNQQLERQVAQGLVVIGDLRAKVTDQEQRIEQLTHRVAAQEQTILRLQTQSKTNQALVDDLRTEAAMTKTEAGMLRRRVEEATAAMALINREMDVAKGEPG